MVEMLRNYDEPEEEKSTPRTELYDEVQEAMDPFELRTVKQKLRAAIEAAIEATAGSAYWLGSGAVTPTLQLPAFKLVLRQLSVHKEQRPDDHYIATRLFAALDGDNSGDITFEELCRGLVPAYCRQLRLRLRWAWMLCYDEGGVGEVSAPRIFTLLEEMPEGCRLEEDLLGLVKLAAGKTDTDEAHLRPARVAITLDEYIHNASLSHSNQGPDVLGLRRRKRTETARLMRERARGLMLAKVLAKGSS